MPRVCPDALIWSTPDGLPPLCHEPDMTWVPSPYTTARLIQSGEVDMPLSGSKLVARVIREDKATFRAEFVASKVPGRLPAVRLLPSRNAAKWWVQQEAAALGVEVEWEGCPAR